MLSRPARDRFSLEISVLFWSGSFAPDDLL
jgi:hypothetical protein